MSDDAQPTIVFPWTSYEMERGIDAAGQEWTLVQGEGRWVRFVTRSRGHLALTAAIAEWVNRDRETTAELLSALRVYAKYDEYVNGDEGDPDSNRLQVARAAIARAEAHGALSATDQLAGALVRHADGYQVRHLDGNAENNDLSNLRVEKTPTVREAGAAGLLTTEEE